MKTRLLLFIIFLLLFDLSNNIYAQLLTPYNLDFEENYFNNITGWNLSRRSEENGFIVSIDQSSPFSGSQSVKLEHTSKKNIGNATFSQTIDASIYRNRQVKFSAWLRLEGDIKAPAIFLSSRTVDMKTAQNQTDNTVLSAQWTKFEVVLDIPNEAKTITYGLTYNSKGTVFIDDCNFDFVRDGDSAYYEEPNPLEEYELNYLTAFAKTYGHVKYFCANKTVVDADWHDILLKGINLRKNIKSEEDIISVLNKFYSTLAPQVLLSNDEKNIAKSQPQTHRFAIAKIYKGVPTNLVESYLTENKTVSLASSLKEQKGVVVQYIENLAPHSGKEITASISAKLKGTTNFSKANLAIRFEDAMGDFIDYKQSDDIISKKWQKYNISHKIPEATTRALVILSFNGYGEAYFDDIQINLRENNQNVAKINLNNKNFEKHIAFDKENWLIANETLRGKYEVSYSTKEKYEGKSSLLIYSDPASQPNSPKYGEIITEKIADNIFLSFPIAIEADIEEGRINDSVYVDYITYPKAAEFDFSTGKNDNFNFSWQDRTSRLAMFIETWNLLKHFSLTNINADSLNKALEKGLKAVAVSNSKIDFRNLLQNLLDISEDIRARVWFNDDNSQKYSLPFIIEKIDDRFFVASGNLDKNDIDFYGLTQNKINFGDEIIEINGKTTEELFDNKMTKSSKKWKSIRELMLYRLGEENSSLKFKFKRNDGEIFEQTLVRNIKSNFVTRQKIDPIVKIDTNTIYLNFSYMDDKYINSYIDTLATYKNFIIDLRGDIIVSEAFISLISDKHFGSSQICLPFFAKPNKELMTYYKQSGIYAPVETKKLDGKFIFLTDWQTAGNSELFASVVKDTKVGKIVGQATQGALVSSVTIRLDADFSISLGTVYGYSPKGKDLLNAPVEPDIPVKTTVEDLKNNIDPIFEAAIKALK